MKAIGFHQKFDYRSVFKIASKGRVVLSVSAMLGSAVIAVASPIGGQVVHGSAHISQSAQTTLINQSSGKAVINWNSFSIKPSETVRFQQPNISSITLNRVIGNEKSIIDGTLRTNGQVFLINAHGVLISKNAQINTACFLATTMNIKDKDFLKSNYKFSSTGVDGTIVNMGTITASNSGYIVLAGKTVSNEGLIVANKGVVHLASGDKITLNLNGNSLLNIAIDKSTFDAMVENKGIIKADGGAIYLTANAAHSLLKSTVNTAGIVEAQTLDDLTGSVTIKANGGTANIAGTIDASAPISGNGGFVETSGKNVHVADGTKITTKSSRGTSGEWLIDPINFTILNDNSAQTTSSIGAVTLSNNLGSSSVTIQTVNDSGSDYGNILVNGDVTWSTTNNLTLKAYSDIKINKNITASAGTLTLKAGYNTDHYGGQILQDSSASTMKVVGTTTLSATAGTGDITLDNTANSLQNVTVQSGYNVVLKSAYNGDANIVLPTNSHKGIQNVTIDYPNATDVKIGNESTYGQYLAGNLVINSGGTITENGYINMTGTSATSTLTAGGDITLSRAYYGGHTNIGAVTATTASTANVNIFNDSTNADLTLTSPIKDLTLTQRNASYTLADNKVTGSLLIDVSGGTITNNTITIGAESLSGSMHLYAENGITPTDSTKVWSVGTDTILNNSTGLALHNQINSIGTTTLSATAGTGDITLDNTANSLQNVTVQSGYNVVLKSAYNGDANIVLPTNSHKGIQNVTIDYPNATDVKIGNESTYGQYLAGNLVINSGGTITENGYINMTGTSATSTLTAGGDITLSRAYYGGHTNIGAVTATTASTANVNIFNDSTNADLTLTSPIKDLTLTQRNASYTLADNKVTGSLSIDVTGGTDTTNTITVGAETLSGNINLKSENGITGNSAITTTGTTTLSATAGTGDITLDNTANSLQNVTVQSGYNVVLKSAYNGDANIVLPTNSHKGIQNVTIDYPNATDVKIGNESTYGQYLAGNLVINSGGTITENGYINMTGTSATSTLTAGGDITLSRAYYGGHTNIGAVTATTASTANVNIFNDSTNADLTLTSPIKDLTLTQRNASYTLADNKVTGSLLIDVSGGTITNNTITIGAESLSGSLTLHSEGDISQTGSWTTGGAIVLNATSGAINLGNDITANVGITFSPNVLLAGDVTIDTTGSNSADVAFNSQVNGAHALSVFTQNSRSVTFNGAVGSATPLASIHVGANSITAQAVTTTGEQTWEGNTLTLNGGLTGSGTMTLEPYTPSTTIGIGSGTGSWKFDNTIDSKIQPGFSKLILGRTDGTGNVDIGAYTFNLPTSILSVAGGDITLNGDITANGSGDALVIAGKNFINSSNHTLNTPNGRWLVYSSNPTDTVEGISTYNKRYNTSYQSTSGVGSGNYMLYSINPTLTVVGDDKSRIYGEQNPTLTYSTSTTGLIDGDTLANALSGDVTTAATSTSDVGSYAITQGTLASQLGYTISYTDSALTINPKQLSASIIGNPTKTYDGTTAATLTPSNYSLSGFIGSQGATVTQTLGTYNSPDVATASSVSATLASIDFSANSGTKLSNYIEPTVASGAGTIIPVPTSAPTYQIELQQQVEDAIASHANGNAVQIVLLKRNYLMPKRNTLVPISIIRKDENILTWRNNNEK